MLHLLAILLVQSFAQNFAGHYNIQRVYARDDCAYSVLRELTAVQAYSNATWHECTNVTCAPGGPGWVTQTCNVTTLPDPPPYKSFTQQTFDPSDESCSFDPIRIYIAAWEYSSKRQADFDLCIPSTTDNTSHAIQSGCEATYFWNNTDCAGAPTTTTPVNLTTKENCTNDPTTQDINTCGAVYPYPTFDGKYDIYSFYTGADCDPTTIIYREITPADHLCSTYQMPCGDIGDVRHSTTCAVAYEDVPASGVNVSESYILATYADTDTACTGKPTSWTEYKTGVCIRGDVYSTDCMNVTKYSSNCVEFSSWEPLLLNPTCNVSTQTIGLCNTPLPTPIPQPDPQPEPEEPEPQPEPEEPQEEPAPQPEEPVPQPQPEGPAPQPQPEEPQPEEPAPQPGEPAPQPQPEEPTPQPQPSQEPEPSNEPAPEPSATDSIIDAINNPQTQAAVSNAIALLMPAGTATFNSAPTTEGNFVFWTITVEYDLELTADEVALLQVQIAGVVADALGTDASKVNIQLTASTKRAVQVTYEALATISGGLQMVASALVSVVFLVLFI